MTHARGTILALGCFLAALPGSLSAAGADSLTVADVVREVVAHHPVIDQTTDEASAADTRVKETHTAWYPAVDFFASYTRLAPIAELQLGPEDFRLFPANNYDMHIGARQQLYDFSKTSSVEDVNRSRAQAAREGIALARTGVAYQAIQTFYMALYLRAAVTVQDDRLRTLREHIDITKKKVASGSATDFDVLTTEVRVAAAENQRIDLRNAQTKAEVQLARLMGRGDAGLPPLSGSFDHSTRTAEVDSLVRLALEQRPELRVARSDEETARLQVRVADVSDHPSLNLGAEYGIKNGYIPNLDVLRGNIAVGVQLDVPIFEGGRAGLRREEADAMLRASQSHTSDLQLQVAQEVRQSYSDLRAAADKLASTDLQVRQSREALSIARKRYDAGTASNLDLLDAESALQQADLLRLQALFACTAGKYMLDRAVGSETWR